MGKIVEMNRAFQREPQIIKKRTTNLAGIVIGTLSPYPTISVSKVIVYQLTCCHCYDTKPHGVIPTFKISFIRDSGYWAFQGKDDE